MQSQNVNAFRNHAPQLASDLEAFYHNHQIDIQTKEDGDFVCTFISHSSGLKNEWTLENPLKQANYLQRQYQTYIASRHWLVFLGIDALVGSNFEPSITTGKHPLLVIEPDFKRFTAHAAIYNLQPFISKDRVYWFIGERGLSNAINALSEELEPYFLTGGTLHLVKSSHIDEYQSQIQSFMADFFIQFKHNSNTTLQLANQFLRFYNNPNLSKSKTVLIVEPSVNCWLILGHGLGQGFQDLGFEVLEHRVSYPASKMSIYESLKLWLNLIKLKPEYIVTLSHPSDLFVNGISKIPIKRLIWYVDEPANLALNKHGPYDYLFYSWKEFAEGLKDRGGILAGEIPIGGYPMTASVRDEFQCEVGFVGSVMDTSNIREQLPNELNVRVDELVNLKMQNLTSDIPSLLQKLQWSEEEKRQVIEIIQPLLRQPGMSDEQLLSFYLLVESIRERRLTLLAHLHEYELKIYGNPDWESFLAGTPIEGAYQGRGLRSQECCDFYRSATISLNIHPLFPHSGPATRDLDVPMCDGFLLSDMHIFTADRTKEFFQPDDEIALFNDSEDLRQKVAFYLSHPRQRQSITDKAKNRIVCDHNYKDRAQHMIETLNKLER